jgi:hypothetical protein
MLGPVLEHVHQRIANFAGRTEDARMVTIRPDEAAAAEDAIDGTRDANRKSLKAVPKIRVPISLDDEMQVISLNAEMQEPKCLA